MTPIHHYFYCIHVYFTGESRERTYYQGESENSVGSYYNAKKFENELLAINEAVEYGSRNRGRVYTVHPIY